MSKVKIGIVGSVSSGKTFLLRNLFHSLADFQGEILDSTLLDRMPTEETKMYAYSHEEYLFEYRMGGSSLLFVDVPGEIYEAGSSGSSLYSEFDDLGVDSEEKNLRVIKCKSGERETLVVVKDDKDLVALVYKVIDSIETDIVERKTSYWGQVDRELGAGTYRSKINDLLLYLFVKYGYSFKVTKTRVSRKEVFDDLLKYNMNSVAIVLAEAYNKGVNDDLMKMVFPIWFARKSDHFVFCEKMARNVINGSRGGRNKNIHRTISYKNNIYHLFTGLDALIKLDNLNHPERQEPTKSDLYFSLYEDLNKVICDKNYQSEIFYDLWKKNNTYYTNELNNEETMRNAIYNALGDMPRCPWVNVSEGENTHYRHTYYSAFPITEGGQVCRCSSNSTTFDGMDIKQKGALLGSRELMIDILYHTKGFKNRAKGMMHQMHKVIAAACE